MSKARAKKWPAQFLSAIKPGANLEEAKNPFLIIILESCLKSMKEAKYDKAKFKDVTEAIEGSRKIIDEMIARLKEDHDISDLQESAAWSAAAWSAARAAAAYDGFGNKLLVILKSLK